MDEPTRAAVSDVLHFLTDAERRAFFRTPAPAPSDYSLCGHPVEVIRIGLARRGPPVPATLPATLPAPQPLNLPLNLPESALARALAGLAEGQSERFFLEGDTLLLLHTSGAGKEAHLVALPPAALGQFLAASLERCRITAAQRRLLALLLCGVTLHASAARDGKSIETQKSHARDLRGHFGAATTGDVVRIVAARLAAAVAAMLAENARGRHEVFFDYVRRFLPASVRPVVLTGEDEAACRVIDMGPRDGRPVVALHPIILPDLRQADVDLLHALRIRLIWPLRDGQLAPLDPDLPEDEVMRRACRALDLVRRTFCEEPLTLLSFAAASRLALAYAQASSGRVRHVVFAAACEVAGRPQRGARRLARGMMALGAAGETVQRAALGFFARKVLRSRSFPGFLRGQFADSPADRAMIEAELGAPFHGARMREALLASVRSARHDFGFQRDLGWDAAPACGAQMHFIHGDEDRIHPVALIARRAAAIPGARLHRIAGAGQLLYGPHFAPLMRRVAAVVGEAPPVPGRSPRVPGEARVPAPERALPALEHRT